MVATRKGRAPEIRSELKTAHPERSNAELANLNQGCMFFSAMPAAVFERPGHALFEKL